MMTGVAEDSERQQLVLAARVDVSALKLVEEQDPDLVLLDINMSAGRSVSVTLCRLVGLRE